MNTSSLLNLPTTRRKVLSGLTGILATSTAPAYITKSLLGAKDILGPEDIPPEDPTAADYIQDGLVAMWDGIENAGYGLHDSEPTVWVDLVGSFNLSKIGNPIILDDAISSYGTSSTVGYFQNTYLPDWISPDIPITMEIVFSKNNQSSISFIGCGGGCLNVMLAQGAIYLKTYGGKHINWQTDSERHSLSFSVTTGEYKSQTASSLLSASLDGYTVPIVNGQYYSFSTNYGVFIGKGGNPSLAYNGCEICAMRIYCRTLSEKETKYNNSIDRKRFNLN